MLNNVCILATKHNISKTYIHDLIRNGFTPSTILYVDIQKKPTQVKQKKSILFQIKNSIKSIIQKPAGTKQTNNSSLDTILPIIRENLSFNQLCDIDLRIPTTELLDQLKLKYQIIQAEHINDESLAKFIINHISEKYIIFCGGGILKKPMFDTGKKFIHVHPGIVPEVKGADCLLWSVLVKKEIGMSCFFMNEGIDTGDIINQKRYPVPKIFPSDFPEKYVELSKILIDYLDPAYRSDTLVENFKKDINPENWEVQNQTGDDVYYHFMHPELAKLSTYQFIQ